MNSPLWSIITTLLLLIANPFESVARLKSGWKGLTRVYSGRLSMSMLESIVTDWSRVKKAENCSIIACPPCPGRWSSLCWLFSSFNSYRPVQSCTSLSKQSTHALHSTTSNSSTCEMIDLKCKQKIPASWGPWFMSAKRKTNPSAAKKRTTNICLELSNGPIPSGARGEKMVHSNCRT